MLDFVVFALTSVVASLLARLVKASFLPQPNRIWRELIVSTLAELRQYNDVTSLKSALHQLCSEFGRITRLDILTAMHEGTKQAICFLRMERPEQEQVLMKSLGVGRFGGEVVFVLNLNMPVTAEEGPSSQWADSDIY
jgi:hypothetical protein